LISETYEKASIVVTSNKSFESWAEMMGDSVMTSALLDKNIGIFFLYLPQNPRHFPQFPPTDVLE